jgi:hypothetical protein
MSMMINSHKKSEHPTPERISGERHEGRSPGKIIASLNPDHDRRQVTGRGEAWICPDFADLGVTSRLEQMAAAVTRPLPSRNALLGVLLEATLPNALQGRSTHRLVWSNEALERAHSTLLLVKALERAVPLQDCRSSRALDELCLANELAKLFSKVSILDGRGAFPCSQALRCTVRNTVELFAPGIGDIKVQTSIEPTMLPAFKRRALIFLAYELVTNALRHAFHAQKGGKIIVTLYQTELSRACFSVSDDGVGFQKDDTCQCGVAYDLASILSSELIYTSRRNCGTAVEIDFQTHAMQHAPRMDACTAARNYPEEPACRFARS